MITSMVKDITNEWNKQRYEGYDETDLNYLNAQENLIEKLSAKKQSFSDRKQEISLPKTKLTRRGQLFLYTDNQNEISQFCLNENLLKKQTIKSNPKKWIDEITENFNLNPSEIFEEKFEENIATLVSGSSQIAKKVGKDSNYFIQDLRSKSGRSRYLQYLPTDFGTKADLEMTLRHMTQSEMSTNKSSVSDLNRSNSRQTATSVVSIFQDEANTDDERNDENELIRLNSSKAQSRLSSHPILCPQQLIRRLNCKDYLTSLVNHEPSSSGNNSLNLESGASSTINYKNMFFLDDLRDHISEVNEFQDDDLAASSDRKKILTRRTQLNNNTPNLQSTNTENLETFPLSYSNAAENRSQPSKADAELRSQIMKSRTSSKSPSQLNFSYKRERPGSSFRSNSRFDVDLNKARLSITGLKQVDSDGENLPTIRAQSSSQNQRNLATPLQNLEKSGESIFPFKSAYDDASAEPEEEHLKPITISVTQIDHELTGTSIKVRRFFDRQTMRINKIALRPLSKADRLASAAKLRRTSSGKFGREVTTLDDQKDTSLSNKENISGNQEDNQNVTLESSRDIRDEKGVCKFNSTKLISAEVREKIKIELEQRQPVLPGLAVRIKSAPLSNVEDKENASTEATNVEAQRRGVKSAQSRVRFRDNLVSPDFDLFLRNKSRNSSSRLAGSGGMQRDQSKDRVSIRDDESELGSMRSGSKLSRRSAISTKSGNLLVEIDGNIVELSAEELSEAERGGALVLHLPNGSVRRLSLNSIASFKAQAAAAAELGLDSEIEERLTRSSHRKHFDSEDDELFSDSEVNEFEDELDERAGTEAGNERRRSKRSGKIRRRKQDGQKNSTYENGSGENNAEEEDESEYSDFDDEDDSELENEFENNGERNNDGKMSKISRRSRVRSKMDKSEENLNSTEEEERRKANVSSRLKDEHLDVNRVQISSANGKSQLDIANSMNVPLEDSKNNQTALDYSLEGGNEAQLGFSKEKAASRELGVSEGGEVASGRHAKCETCESGDCHHKNKSEDAALDIGLVEGEQAKAALNLQLGLSLGGGGGSLVLSKSELEGEERQNRFGLGSPRSHQGSTNQNKSADEFSMQNKESENSAKDASQKQITSAENTSAFGQSQKLEGHLSTEESKLRNAENQDKKGLNRNSIEPKTTHESEVGFQENSPKQFSSNVFSNEAKSGMGLIITSDLMKPLQQQQSNAESLKADSFRGAKRGDLAGKSRADAVAESGERLELADAKLKVGVAKNLSRVSLNNRRTANSESKLSTSDMEKSSPNEANESAEQKSSGLEINQTEQLSSIKLPQVGNKKETPQIQNEQSKNNSNSKINQLLGIKEENEAEKKKPNERKEVHSAVVLSGARYPYLQIPWDHEEAIVDPEVFSETFQIPDILYPNIHEIDATCTSLEELLLERRVLEDKIIELRETKLKCINTLTPEKQPKKADKAKKLNKKDEQKLKKEKEMKEKIIREERQRLRNDAITQQMERENQMNGLIDKINAKISEVDTLNRELEANTQKFKEQIQNLVEQINELEASEDEIREILSVSRIEMREKFAQRLREERNSLKKRQEDRKDEKMFDFEVKKKEIQWLLEMYTDADELEKYRFQLFELDNQIENWLFKFENQVIEEEKAIDEKELDEENKLMLLEQEEEENAIKPIRQEQFNLMTHKKNIMENFDEIKLKILTRIEKLNEEKNFLENEKKTFDETNLKTIQLQKAKLLEILQAESDAKKHIQNELEQYRQSLMNAREKNLKMKSSLSFLRHSHAVNKPHVFTYLVDWPVENLTKGSNQEKKKITMPKK